MKRVNLTGALKDCCNNEVKPRLGESQVRARKAVVADWCRVMLREASTSKLSFAGALRGF
jgi:hypothetical protein